MGSIFVLSLQFHICTRTGNKVMSGNTLLFTIKESRIHYRMALPTTKRVAHGRTESTGHRSNGNKTYSATTIFILQHIAQIRSKNIRFNEGISENGNTHLTGTLCQFIQSPVKRCHAAQSRITVVFNARHTRTAGIHKCRFHLRRRRKQTVRFFRNIFLSTHVTQQVDTPHHVFTYRKTGQEVHQ